MTPPLAILLIVSAIGIVAGLIFHRYGQGWWGRTVTSAGSPVTSILVGIAGAFLGFHVGVVLGILPSPLMWYLTGVVGAALVLWLWRGR
jgi:uncharacterized membrane protein YeaQ/YmgE (transglycosylase-associated protein family)